MKLLFIWTGVTSYMADCWRQLSSESGVELKVIVEKAGSGSEFKAAEVLSGLDCRVVEPGELGEKELQRDYGAFNPDALFAVGWHSPTVRAASVSFPNARRICCFDMPWRRQLRCFAAKFVLYRYLRRFHAAYVPGAAAERYAKWLGFKEIHRGLFSIAQSRFAAPESDDRQQPPAKRIGFYYIGRFSPEKRMDIILDAYRRYRAAGGTWQLDFYGAEKYTAGELPNGVACHGFLQPDRIPDVHRAHACLLLASAFDPWPLVILEARAAQSAAIVSDRCGNAKELGAITFDFGNAEKMAETMLRFERGEIRSETRDIAKYDCREWSVRTQQIAIKLNK